MKQTKARFAFCSLLVALLLGFMFADPALADGIGKIVAVVQQLFGGPVNPTATTGQVLTKQANGSLAFATPGGGGSQTLAQTLGFGNTTGANDINITNSKAILFGNAASSAFQIGWGTGLGTITHEVGPSDQPFVIAAGGSQSLQFWTGSAETLRLTSTGGLSAAGEILLTGTSATPFIDSVTSTAAISAAGHGRIRFVTGTGWQTSTDGGAYATLATGGVTNLQTAYAGGATIATTGAVTIAFSNANTDAATVLSVNKSPGGAAAGNAFVVQSGANASGAAASISHAGSGFALTALASGTGGVAVFQNSGTSTAPILDLDNTGSNNGGGLRVTKEPSGAQSGDGLTVVMGTVSSGITSGKGLLVTMTAGKSSGLGLSVNQAGTGTGVAISMAGDAGSSALFLDGGTVTSTSPTINSTQTWNNAGAFFSGMIMSVTDTASDAQSRLISIECATTGASFRIQKSGATFLTATNAFPALTVVGQYYSSQTTCTTTLNWNDGNAQRITLANGAQTFTFANGQAGGRYLVKLKQPAAGAAGTVTWPASVLWPSATPPTLTATNGQTDIITFYFDGTNFFGGYTLNF